MSRIEHLGKPVLAMVNGFALGGGLELAMACHLRIAADTAKVGQPEVNLGLVPGFGGTQRLLRLAGRSATLELCLLGQPIDAARALQLGVADPRGAPPTSWKPRPPGWPSSWRSPRRRPCAACWTRCCVGGETSLEAGLDYETQVVRPGLLDRRHEGRHRRLPGAPQAQLHRPLRPAARRMPLHRFHGGLALAGHKAESTGRGLQPCALPAGAARVAAAARRQPGPRLRGRPAKSVAPASASAWPTGKSAPTCIRPAPAACWRWRRARWRASRAWTPTT